MSFNVTATGIPVNETCFDERIELPCDAEFTLPDYCPDISRVLKCKITPVVHSKNLNGSTLSVDGVNVITLIYADEDKQIRSYEHHEPFSKGVEIGVQPADCTIVITPQTDYLNSKAMSQRKMDVHGSVSLHCKGKSHKHINVVSDIDSGHCHSLKKQYQATKLINTTEKHLNLTDEVSLGNNKSPIRNIIRHNSRAVANENKIISNKIVVKGDLLTDILYTSDDTGDAETHQCTLPISQIVEIEGLHEDCHCSVNIEVQSVDCKPRTGSDGEVRSIGINAKLVVHIRSYCNEPIPYIVDAYSTKHKMKTEKASVPVSNFVAEINDNQLCKKTLTMPTGSVSSIVDMWCEQTMSNVTAQNDELNISGDVLICMLAKDQDDQPMYVEQVADYSYNYNLPKSVKTITSDPVIVPVSNSFTIQGDDTVEARVELSICAEIFESSHIEALSECEIDEEAPLNKEKRSPLVIYFAEKGENTWNIARNYQTSCEEIESLNHLDSSEVTGKKMLLIPSEKS